MWFDDGFRDGLLAMSLMVTWASRAGGGGSWELRQPKRVAFLP